MSTKPNRISIDPEVMVGKLVVAGTRLTVEFILGLLAKGWSVEQILNGYPHIERDDILACLSYAHGLVEKDTSRHVTRAR